MPNKFLVFSILSFAAGCSFSFNQQPAPVEKHSERYYGRTTNTALIPDKYKVDKYGRPTYDTPKYNAASTSSFIKDAPDIRARKLEPLAIDGEESVIGYNSGRDTLPVANQAPVHQPAHNQYSERAAFGERVEQQPIYETQPAQQQAVVNEGGIRPIVRDSRTEYLDLSTVSASKTEIAGNDKLASIKPAAKPAFRGVAEPVRAQQTASVPAPLPVPSRIEPAQPAQQAETIQLPPTSPRIETSSGTTVQDTGNEIRKMEAAQSYAEREAKQLNESNKLEREVNIAEEKVEEVKTASTKQIEDVNIRSTGIGSSGGKFIRPVDGVIVSEFGSQSGGKQNDGINIQAPEGSPVKAAAGGTVVYSGNQLQGYGNLIIIRHPDGYLTAYSHLQGLDIRKGEKVNQGDVIGRVGKSGNVDTPQLHFGVRKGREPVDPKDYL